MYSAIWKILPGPFWLRISLAAILAAAVIAGLMIFVFPWVDTLMTSQNSSVG
jgi:hypothetical protein